MMIAPILAILPILARHDLDPMVNPIEVTITGSCSNNSIYVSYKNDRSPGGIGAFSSIKYDGVSVGNGITELNSRLEGRKISSVSLLTCSEKPNNSFSALITIDKNTGFENSKYSYIGITIFRDRVLLDPIK